MDGQISCNGEDRSWLRYAKILVETPASLMTGLFIAEMMHRRKSNASRSVRFFHE